MTVALSGKIQRLMINGRFSGSVVASDNDSVEVKPEFLVKISDYLKIDPELGFNYLNSNHCR
jgi:hypothetical protein